MHRVERNTSHTAKYLQYYAYKDSMKKSMQNRRHDAIINLECYIVLHERVINNA